VWSLRKHLHLLVEKNVGFLGLQIHLLHIVYYLHSVVIVFVPVTSLERLDEAVVVAFVGRISLVDNCCIQLISVILLHDS
jgi:hypothetical protein